MTAEEGVAVRKPANFPLTQHGIYRNLPQFDPHLKKLRAIVCGGSGISGFNTLLALLSTDRWEIVYSVARSPLPDEALQLFTEKQRKRIVQLNIDLSSEPSKIASKLRGSEVAFDYVFFYTYINAPSEKGAMHPDSAQTLAEANVPLVRNFLAALDQLDIHPKRILLQTGGKNYGMHIGRVRTPLVESDPQPRHLARNFYYEQEDALKGYCQRTGTAWNVIHPAGVVGVAPKPAMTMFTPFAIYAIVQARRSRPLYFGGDFDAWQFAFVHSTARLTGYLSEWAVLEDGCANQSFNAQDGGPLTWDRFFHQLATWFGVEKGVVGPKREENAYSVTTMAGGQKAPLGYGPPLEVRRSFSLAEWAADDGNHQIWEEVVQEGAAKGFKYVNPWSGNLQETMAGDFAYLNFGSLSPHKVKRYGFNGYVDTAESVFEMYTEMAALGQLPQPNVTSADPTI